MTAHCRPLLVSAVALLLPACLHIDAPPPTPQPDQASKPSTTQTTDPIRKTQFAELLSRPGVVISTKLNLKDTTTPERTSDVQSDVKPASGSPPELPVGPIQPTPLPELPLVAAVRAYAAGRPGQAIEYLSSLDKPNQELMLAVLPVLAQGATLDMNADPNTTAVLADQLRSAAARIEPLAGLRLEVATLCTTVFGYGRYDPRPKGQPYHANDQAQLYVEVRNLASQPTVGPHGETFLIHARVTVEIRDAHEKLVDQPSIEDPRRLIPVIQYEKNIPTRTPIHDFHILYGFPVPPPPGVYTVSMTIQDLLSRRVVKTKPIEFTVAGDGVMR
jgi:hypothetical protein